jgi:hypothetical protein
MNRKGVEFLTQVEPVLVKPGIQMHSFWSCSTSVHYSC